MKHAQDWKGPSKKRQQKFRDAVGVLSGVPVLESLLIHGDDKKGHADAGKPPNNPGAQGTEQSSQGCKYGPVTKYALGAAAGRGPCRVKAGPPPRAHGGPRERKRTGSRPAHPSHSESLFKELEPRAAVKNTEFSRLWPRGAPRGPQSWALATLLCDSERAPEALVLGLKLAPEEGTGLPRRVSLSSRGIRSFSYDPCWKAQSLAGMQNLRAAQANTGSFASSQTHTHRTSPVPLAGVWMETHRTHTVGQHPARREDTLPSRQHTRARGTPCSARQRGTSPGGHHISVQLKVKPI